ncbi:MAG: PadR family transcriptional regulator [Erysipelotrichaceae bacterium]
MISSDVIRGYNDIIILAILLTKNSYGYEISKEIEVRSKGVYIIKETTLYSSFNRLEKNGYVDSYYGEATLGKRRTYYRITEEGKKYYDLKCQEWKETKILIDDFTSKKREK